MTMRAYQDTWPQCAEHTYIDVAATVIGAVSIGDYSSVWPGVVIRGDVNPISIGSYTNIQDNSVLHTTHASENTQSALLRIGDYVTVGHGVMLHGCTIEEFCLIGMRSVILDHAHLAPYVMVGAGSVVAPGKRLESGYLYVGTPAKKVRALTVAERNFFKYSAQHYVRLQASYR